MLQRCVKLYYFVRGLWPQGALLMLLGVTLAATNAFLIARGVGRPLAQKVIDMEMSHANDGDGGSSGGGTVAKTLADVQAAIEGGGLWKQLTAITLLRLTPVVSSPCSPLKPLNA
jgi:hypothetical protein